MADIELVIKIPKEEYEMIVDSEDCGLNILTRAIAHGTMLPKGHGILIDADGLDEAVYKKFDGIQCYDGTGYDIYSDMKYCIDNVPTIIEADKEVKSD